MNTKYIILALSLCITSICSAQSNLFEKFADMDHVTSVYISKAMFQMMPQMNDVGLNLANMAGKIESLQIVTTEKEDKINQMRKEFPQLVTNKHQELMRVKDGNTRVTFYTNMVGNKVHDLIMLADTEGNFTAIQLVGNFTIQDIQEITKDVK